MLLTAIPLKEEGKEEARSEEGKDGGSMEGGRNDMASCHGSLVPSYHT